MALSGWPSHAWSLLASLFLVILLLRLLLARLPVRLPSIVARFTPALRFPPVPYPLILLSLTLGAARYQSTQPVFNPGLIAWYNDRDTPFVLEGVLVQPPDERDLYTNLRVRVDRLHPVGETSFLPVTGYVLARVPPGASWHYGDRLRLEGNLQTAPEDEEFSYRDYLAREGVYAYMSRASADLLVHGQGNPLLAGIYKLKERAQATVYLLFPDPEASLMSGILLGVETGIPKPVQEAFKDTGTSHIIAISGFNITILSGLFATILGRLMGKRRRFLAAGLTTLVIAAYTVLVGAEAAVVRAAIMGGLSLFARQLGRRQEGLNSLTFVAALMAAFTPNILWQAGFQLSFAATLGLVLYADPLSQAFIRLASQRLPLILVQRLAGPVGEYFLFTLAAQLTTLPVMAYHFRRISIVSFLVNPAILPVQPAVMVLGGVAVILGLVWAPLGQAAAYLAWPFIAYTIRVVELFARLPGGTLALGRVALPAVALFYAWLLGWTFAMPRLPRWSPGIKPSLVLLPLGALAVVVWQAVFSAPDGRLHLTVLDVGSGDGFLIQSPSGRYLLVDGGPSASLLSDGLGRRLPLLQRQLDWLVVAAAGDEQLAALPRLLERFPVRNVLWAGPPSGSRSARDLQAYLVQKEISMTAAESGQTLDLGEGAILRVLSGGKRGAVLLLEWGSFHALLPVGLDFESMGSLQTDNSLAPVTALLLGDSGYAPINPPEWIARWRPQLVLVSVGAGDRRGLPDPETLEAVQGYTLLRTDQNGWIHLSTDGEQMWVEVEKPSRE